jgi:hypothetical protein
LRHHDRVSVYFKVSGVLVWNPSAGVGHLYVAQLDAAARFAGMDSGLSYLTGDPAIFVVDPATFGALINELLHTYQRSNHTVLRHQLRALLAPSVVMLSRSQVPYDMPEDDTLQSDVAHIEPAMPV